MGRQLRVQRPPIRNISDLSDRCLNIWYNLSPVIYQGLVASLPRWVEVVLRANGVADTTSWLFAGNPRSSNSVENAGGRQLQGRKDFVIIPSVSEPSRNTVITSSLMMMDASIYQNVLCQ
ncbi:transposase domain containing protein [Nephila pilipes]|uniref:Transposase domain containing protein n=1 Tax=Nephila pilipes TaxID=299642 RepID=A0A8X6PCL9_NEPPI|nr:transposase domain containing protein [Nephila pilipes]